MLVTDIANRDELLSWPDFVIIPRYLGIGPSEHKIDEIIKKRNGLNAKGYDSIFTSIVTEIMSTKRTN